MFAVAGCVRSLGVRSSWVFAVTLFSFLWFLSCRERETEREQEKEREKERERDSKAGRHERTDAHYALCFSLVVNCCPFPRPACYNKRTNIGNTYS